MTDKKRFLISSIIGIIGSLMGFYLWKDSIPQYYGDTNVEWKYILRIEKILFLYIPSSIAIIASIFHRKTLMLLAFILSLPVTKYLGVNGFFDTFPLVFYPLICYMFSFLLMLIPFEKSHKNL
ncbi:hypothetical protein K7887_21885 (plasmid) [Sutcliffiella horikoshii]|uniref:hypothetical protein n=1 Tax=Sutcliffiella horikoshii TaxID=79883 RepID=UPI001CBE5656|nr:hypothetical protein [Sutcliffiella horikoshii]UAL49717.1 hypothetical protein K7887_21885 [Sutcliffiella horikoshii]